MGSASSGRTVTHRLTELSRFCPKRGPGSAAGFGHRLAFLPLVCHGEGIVRGASVARGGLTPLRNTRGTDTLTTAGLCVCVARPPYPRHPRHPRHPRIEHTFVCVGQ